mmetsp:Transcript_49437/g.159583  ORF Transcript_49437/g.159583 Transcript_49437/m.159583 type:complete len:218 (-) Transcript_49437:2-655(-)
MRRRQRRQRPGGCASPRKPRSGPGRRASARGRAPAAAQSTAPPRVERGALPRGRRVAPAVRLRRVPAQAAGAVVRRQAAQRARQGAPAPRRQCAVRGRQAPAQVLQPHRVHGAHPLHVRGAAPPGATVAPAEAAMECALAHVLRVRHLFVLGARALPLHLCAADVLIVLLLPLRSLGAHPPGPCTATATSGPPPPPPPPRARGCCAGRQGRPTAAHA